MNFFAKRIVLCIEKVKPSIRKYTMTDPSIKELAMTNTLGTFQCAERKVEL